MTGTIKYVPTPGSAAVISQRGVAGGNYFPLSLGASCKGIPVTVKRTSTSKAESTQTNTEWLLSLPDGTETTYTIICDDKVIANLSFSDATLLKDATEIVSVIPQTETQLEKQISELMSEDTAVGPNGNVTGTLHYVEGWTQFSNAPAQQEGHYIAVRLDEAYGQKLITVKGKNEKTETDRDWILIVENEDSTFKFSADGAELFTLTFKDVTFEPKDGD